MRASLKIMSTIPKKTNDIVHLSALEDYSEPFAELGSLLHQGPLHVTEAKALRSVEKERQFFLFAKTILVCKQQRRENGQFYYSFKRKIVLTVRNKSILVTHPCIYMPDPVHTRCVLRRHYYIVCIGNIETPLNLHA